MAGLQDQYNLHTLHNLKCIKLQMDDRDVNLLDDPREHMLTIKNQSTALLHEDNQEDMTHRKENHNGDFIYIFSFLLDKE